MSNTDHIEFSKYKRFFAFGCSCTNWRWPTWADIIGRNIPEYYNFGISGAGNIFISNKLFEMHQRHSFSKDDLIIVMWSGINREDRYIGGSWRVGGNIYNNDIYDEDYLMKYADIRGFLIRDLALISSSYYFLNSLSCDFSMLNMAPISVFSESSCSYDDFLDDIIELYESVLDKIKPDILNTVFNGNFPLTERYDHPLPIHYLKYLQSIFKNFSIDESTKQFVIEHTLNVVKNHPVELFDNGSLNCQGF